MAVYRGTSQFTVLLRQKFRDQAAASVLQNNNNLNIYTHVSRQDTLQEWALRNFSSLLAATKSASPGRLPAPTLYNIPNPHSSPSHLFALFAQSRRTIHVRPSSWVVAWCHAGRLPLGAQVAGAVVGGGVALFALHEHVSCWVNPRPPFLPAVLPLLPDVAPPVSPPAVWSVRWWVGSSLPRFCSSLLRSLHLALLLSPTLLLAPICLFQPFHSLHHTLRTWWSELLAGTLERCGPAFIKWGQWASTRQDLFPREVCTALQRLQDHSSTHDGALSREIIAAAFGCDIDILFSHFEDVPIASGSIAQVHKATLSKEGARITGQEEGVQVAVKVRHPGVEHMVARDFGLMEAFSRVLDTIPGLATLRLGDTLAQFRAPLTEQIDLRIEAGNLRRFEANFCELKEVRFPRPFEPLVAPSVLVESFEEGVSILNLLQPASPQESGVAVSEKLRQAIAQLGCKTLLKMVVKDNFIHADLHPGNLLVRESDVVRPWWWPWFLGPPHSGAQLVLLDAGMVMELSAHHRDHILDFFKAIASMDGNKVATELLKFSNDGCSNPEGFELEMDALFQKMRIVRDAGKTVTEGVADCLDTVRRHHVQVSAELLAVVTATVVLEGWSSVLDRDINILHLLKELLFKAEQMQEKMIEYLKVIT